MIPTYIVKQDRETFTIVAGLDFEKQLNSDDYLVDANMSKSEYLIKTLQDRLDEWISKFMIEEEF